eukprot:3185823-Pyramimonas_sp.AAC.1
MENTPTETTRRVMWHMSVGAHYGRQAKCALHAHELLSYTFTHTRQRQRDRERGKQRDIPPSRRRASCRGSARGVGGNGWAAWKRAAEGGNAASGGVTLGRYSLDPGPPIPGPLG